jgi:hypothetical protein
MNGFRKVPSQQRLVDAFGISREQANTLREVLSGKLDPETFDSVRRLPDGYRWLDKALEAANEILGTYGVEAIQSETSWVPYWMDIVALYLNAGDTYNPTLLYNRLTGTLNLTTYGDFVERNPKLFE